MSFLRFCVSSSASASESLLLLLGFVEVEVEEEVDKVVVVVRGGLEDMKERRETRGMGVGKEEEEDVL